MAEDPADYQKELVDEFEQFTDLVSAANAIVDDTDARYEAFAKRSEERSCRERV